MEITEFDVRFCYAPKQGAKVQQIFGIYKDLAWKCKFICIFFAYFDMRTQKSPDQKLMMEGNKPSQYPTNRRQRDRYMRRS